MLCSVSFAMVFIDFLNNSNFFIWHFHGIQVDSRAVRKRRLSVLRGGKGGGGGSSGKWKSKNGSG